MAYIERKGPLTATRALSGRGGSDRGGWYIGNFPAVPRLKKLILDRMLKNDALRGAVHAVHASDKQVRLLSRSEVYVDSLADFHFDGNPGTRAFLNQRPNNRSALKLFVANTPIDSRGRLSNGEKQHITTVALYLQAHNETSGQEALSARLGSHRFVKASYADPPGDVKATRRMLSPGLDASTLPRR
eukprot:791398-Prymnesium_polylepis.1